jgi:multiple sugar transport system permease protein
VADPGAARWVGAGNYADLLGDPLFWRALANTLLLVGLGVPATLVLALGGALLVHSRLARLRGLWRTAFFAPVVTTLVAVSVVFRYLYHPRYGLLDQLLTRLGLPAIDWLGDPRWAMPAIALLAVWRTFGYCLVIYVAGLAAIPESLHEAATIDGASWWQRFRHVTWPLLGPTTMFVGVLTAVGFFQVFAEPYVMTRGGPLNATTTISLLMYQQGFRWWSMGRASAIAFVLFAMILAASWLQARLRREAMR